VPSKPTKYRYPEKERAYHRSEDRKRVVRSNNLKRNYGLTLDAYEAMLETQNGLCKICRCVPVLKKWQGRYLHVDHDHTTGRIRGLLCATCNLGVGYFRDRSELLRAAAAYLEGV